MTPEQATLISLGIGIATFFLGRLSSSKNDGKEQGIIVTKLELMQKDIDKISNKMDEKLNDLIKEQQEMRERLVVVEKSTSSAHKRLDGAGIGRHD